MRRAVLCLVVSLSIVGIVAATNLQPRLTHVADKPTCHCPHPDQASRRACCCSHDDQGENFLPSQSSCCGPNLFVQPAVMSAVVAYPQLAELLFVPEVPALHDRLIDHRLERPPRA